MKISTNHSMQHGVGLIEMMVALFVLAIGLLGILAMQAIGVKSTQRATFSTEAQIIAADMVDRILANNDIDTLDDDEAYADIDTADDGSNTDCVEGCDESAQIQRDLFEWKQLVSRLPSGRGTVNLVNGIYTISVVWDNESTKEIPSGDPEGDCANEQLACYQVQVKI